MPIYEYRCSACGFEKDALQRMSDAPLLECPQCGKPALVKLVSAAGFHLKGSGWYATDFKESGKKKAPDKAKPEGGATATETAPTGENSGAATTDSSAKGDKAPAPATAATPSTASKPPTPSAGTGN